MGIHRGFKLKMKLFYFSIIFGIASGCSRVSSEEEEFVATWGDTTTLQSTILDEASVDSTTGGIEVETTTEEPTTTDPATAKPTTEPATEPAVDSTTGGIEEETATEDSTTTDPAKAEPTTETTTEPTTVTYTRWNRGWWNHGNF